MISLPLLSLERTVSWLKQPEQEKWQELESKGRALIEWTESSCEILEFRELSLRNLMAPQGTGVCGLADSKSADQRIVIAGRTRNESVGIGFDRGGQFGQISGTVTMDTWRPRAGVAMTIARVKGLSKTLCKKLAGAASWYPKNKMFCVTKK